MTRRPQISTRTYTLSPYTTLCRSGAVQAATFTANDGPKARYAADLVVPRETWVEITVLKAVAAHYVMQTADRLTIMERQRQLLAELVEAVCARAPDVLEDRKSTRLNSSH